MKKLTVANNAHLRGDVAKAERLYREILRKGFDHEAAANLGVLLINRGALAQAEYFLAKALPEGDATIAANYAVALRNQGRKDEAKEFLSACAAKPGFADNPSALVNFGALLFDLSQFDRAEEVLKKALHLNPKHVDGNWNLSLSRLAQRKWEKGWRGHKWGFAAKQRAARPYVHRYREWSGEDLKGKTLLVWGEQGLGDELMFATCLNDLDCKLVYDCHPRLETTMKRSFPNAHVHGGRKSQDWAWLDEIHVDYHAPIGRIPEFTRPTDESFEVEPYLKPDPGRVAYWQSKIPGPRIGFTWKGGAPQTGSHDRSIRIGQLAPLFQLDANWVCLQYGDCWREVEEMSSFDLFYDAAAIEDFDEQINLTAACDLVVSVVQTSVHVAGSLGVPTFCLTPQRRPWKFPTGGNMPWHPSVRQFHQVTDWTSVIANVRKEIKDWLTAKRVAA